MAFLVSFLVVAVFFLMVNKIWCFWCRSKVNLAGKTAIVTGGASGIGFQVAITLASKGCRIIIADIANISEAVEEMKKKSHNPNIIGLKMDLQSLKSVREFAKQIVDSESRLDILVCNAGTADYRQRTVTEDGLDRTMQINYFGHFLLTHLLLDLLKKSSPSRITFTGSMLAYVSDIDVDDLNPSSQYYKRLLTLFNTGTYSNSKVCMAAAAKTFGEKLKGTGVIANAAHPGIVGTPIFRKALIEDRNFLAIFYMMAVFLYGKNAEEGAQTLLHLAHSDEIKDVTGQSFFEGMRFPPPRQVNDEFCKKLWEASIAFTKLQPDEIKC